MQAKAGKIIPFPLERRFPTPQNRTHTLRVYLVRGPYGRELEGQEIFRTLQLRGNQTLEDLHYAILHSFDRNTDQPYEFYTGGDPYDRSGTRYSCPSSTRAEKGPPQENRKGRAGIAPLVSLDSLELKNDQIFSYWFDMEEEWGHLIHVVSINPARLSGEYPALIEKVGDLPSPSPAPRRDPRDLKELDQGEGQPWDEVLETLMTEFQASWRQQSEEVPLRPNCRLKTALGKIPAPWLQGICIQIGFEGVRTRKERIRKLLQALPDEERLAQIWRELPTGSREILRWVLLENKGWVTIQHLSVKFGRDSDRTWWWHEGEKPATPLGLLRIFGLVYVGKTQNGRRKMRIACVPVELRKPLRQIILNAQPLEKAFSLTEESEPPVTPDQYPAENSQTEGTPTTVTTSLDLCQDLDSQDLRRFMAELPLQSDTETLYAHMLERIRREPEPYAKLEVRKFLRIMTEGCSTYNRLAAYKLGVAMFNKRFASPATSDSSPMIKKWAKDLAKGRQQEDLF